MIEVFFPFLNSPLFIEIRVIFIFQAKIL